MTREYADYLEDILEDAGKVSASWTCTSSKVGCAGLSR